MMEKLPAGPVVALGRNHPCQSNVWLECYSQEQEARTGSLQEAKRTSLFFLQPCTLHLVPPVGRASLGCSQQSRNEISKIQASSITRASLELRSNSLITSILDFNLRKFSQLKIISKFNFGVGNVPHGTKTERK